MIIIKINYLLEKIFVPIRFFIIRKKIPQIKSKNKKVFKKINDEVEKKHKNLWKKLFPHVDKSWLRFYSNVSGIEDYRYIPEDFYYVIIERKLNDANKAIEVANKSQYDLVLNKNLFPKNYLKYVSKNYTDSENKVISFEDAKNIFKNIKRNIIIKPASESGGGQDIIFLYFKKNKFMDKNNKTYDFKSIEKKYQKDFLIQEIVKQNKFFSEFNPKSINTLRVYTYRSIKDEKIKILAIILRMGRKNMNVDNQRSGGISTKVDIHSGNLNNFAVCKNGKKFYKHPDSKILFKKKKMPFVEETISLVKKQAIKIPSQRLLSFDVYINSQNQVKLLEVNTMGQGINLIQLQGEPLFGKYTNEVIQFCKNNKFYNFKYFRTTM